jgi:tetratricopeptide (TPR) repeat protein
MWAEKAVSAVYAVLSLAFLSGCAESPAVEAESQLVTIKARAMSADYRADFAELAQLREEALTQADQPAVGYIAHYWAGFASWRLAINGVNHGMSSEDLEAHLERAATAFDASMQQRDDFADSHAAAALVRSWLAGFYGDDPSAVREQLTLSSRLLERAKELAPANPRVLWAQGAAFLFTPPEYGGSTERAIETYRQMVKAADAAAPTTSPLPDWGKPEALMSLAFAHLNQAAPDLDSAAEEAHEALRLQPAWSYVRDVLLPQIEAEQHKKFIRMNRGQPNCLPREEIDAGCTNLDFLAEEGVEGPSANRHDASLSSFYETHQWFKLGDAVTKTGASTFYRGAVAYAFDDARQAEHYLNPVIAAAPQSERASDARKMLIHLYMRTGRYRKAFSATEKERAVNPDDAGLKTASALLGVLSQSPEQEVSRRRSSEIRYTTKEGNLFIPVDINGKRANYILDTGASYSIVSHSEAKRLGLTLVQGGGHQIEGSSGAKVDFGVAVANQLDVGEFRLRHVAFLVLEDNRQPFVGLESAERGVLGLPVVLSFETLRWKRDGTFEFGFAPSVRRTAVGRLCFDGLQPVIEGQFRESQIMLFLDTGATRTRILPLFAKEFPIFVSRFGQEDSDRVTGVSGSVDVDALRLPELTLRIGGFDTILRHAPVLLKDTTSDSHWWHVWLGMDLLNQPRMVTLDFNSMTVALE